MSYWSSVPSVSKIFGKPYREAGMDRAGDHRDAGFVNDIHFTRYNMDELRFHDTRGAGVVPVYKYQGYFDSGVGDLPRGKDIRNILPCHRSRLQQLKENVSLIHDRPFQ